MTSSLLHQDLKEFFISDPGSRILFCKTENKLV